MKRLFTAAIVFVFSFGLLVSPAIASDHGPISLLPKSPAKARASAQDAPSLRSLARLQSYSLFARQKTSLHSLSSRSFTSGGTNISTAPELPPYPNNNDASGTVTAGGNADDVYLFYLEAGGEIDFSLNAAPGSALNLYVYSPYATDVTADNPIGGNESQLYPAALSFVAPVDGYYYVDVWAASGSASYTLGYELSNSPNDELPGVALTTSPITHWMDQDWDYDDVWAVPLLGGDKLTATVGTYAGGAYQSSDLDVDLYLYGSNATSVFPHKSPDNPGLLAWDAENGNVDSLSFVAPYNGTFYLDAMVYSGWGASNVAWTVTPVRPSVKRTPSGSSLTYKRKHGSAKFTLSARFTDQFGLPIRGISVYLQKSSNGRSWKNFVRATTNSNGTAAVKVTAKKKGRVYFRWYRAATATSKLAKANAQKVTIK